MVTPKEAIIQEIEEQAERIREALICNLDAIGEECVNAARITAMKGRDYKDQTRNLRSSTGYVVVVNGEIVSGSSFEAIEGGMEGAQKGYDFAKRLAASHTNDIALIVVAGMEYAEYVAAKGYDVLDTAEIRAEELVNQLIQDLNGETYQ